MSDSSPPKRAIITGASSGIGRATALAFAQAGIDIALVSRSETKLKAVVDAVAQTGVEAKAYGVDLAQVDQVKAQLAAIAADFYPIDILVNNAGMGYTGQLADTPLADWQQVMDLNLTSAFQCILGVLPQMRDRRTGTILNVASVAGKTPFPGWGAYSVSKAGLIALSKTLAAEERSNGIRVVAFSPGAVNTPIWDTETVQADFNRAAMLTPEIVAQSILHTVLLPEQAVVEDITLMPSGGSL
ncbi:SDR family oxidoreductase [Spirulina sp. CCNP1310]|uniref:SDR family oxidoreductase n=1 Tax=Spirulina sp. CCNP1310 TaxID=3110249 RepID=UPI002B21D5C1|nr:SDR family oxidoreductase [Spirulina sp. CCNP1310]MEA5418170.1 SDR family oxidoreductase [Spirulina sp. CCNP1310]